MSRLKILLQIRQLFAAISPRRRWQLVMLGISMIIGSVAEGIMVLTLFPFLAVLTSSEKILASDVSPFFSHLLRLNDVDTLLFELTVIFCLVAIIVGLSRAGLLFAQTRLASAIGVDFSVKAYASVLYQPYSVHVSRNSSEILAGISKSQALHGTLIQPLMSLLSSIVIGMGLLVTLFAIQPMVAVTTLAGLGLIYLGVVTLTRNRIAINSKTIAVQQSRVTKAIQEGLGGIRDVLLDGSQPFYSKLYRDAYVPSQRAAIGNILLSMSPRFGIEALGLVIIACLAYLLTTDARVYGTTGNAIPVLGAMALGIQRLLPVAQQIYTALSQLQSHQWSTQDALDLLAQPVREGIPRQLVMPMNFRSVIALKNLSFRYSPERPWVLRHANLEIFKGSRVGFVGVTGGGKSTLIDIVMGLLTVTEGALLVDNVEINDSNVGLWQANISHVPQEVYLSDTSIAENIAFGVAPELIDLRRVKEAAKGARIDETVESWTDGYATLVGERGIRLSGGQRQRIGIARALYRKASVVILDEATSALDNDTEAAVMQSLELLSSQITLLIIAHRLTTLKYCDQIFEITGGKVKSIGNYENLSRKRL